MAEQQLPTYPAIIALQWCDERIGVRPAWYPIRPPLQSDGKPWPAAAHWPAKDIVRTDLELMLQ
jgi:hypothetical protein